MYTQIRIGLASCLAQILWAAGLVPILRSVIEIPLARECP